MPVSPSEVLIFLRASPHAQPVEDLRERTPPKLQTHVHIARQEGASVGCQLIFYDC